MNTAPAAHVIGAGLAGLSAAVRLAERGFRVRLYEAAGQAGGRCRSFHDKQLGRWIDNGNHLMMTGNPSVFSYLKLIGAEDSLVGPDRAAFPFIDLKTGQRWTLRPGPGRIPFWLMDQSRRVPDTKLSDYLSLMAIERARPGATVGEVLKKEGALYTRFWEPLTLAVLNTAPEVGAASLLQTVIRETFLKGEAMCRPRIAKHGLADSLVAPALAFLESKGASVQFNRRLKALGTGGGRVTELGFTDSAETVAPADVVVMALPPSRAAQILPDLDPPGEGEAIVNAHFRLPEPPRIEGDLPLIGLINSASHWVFVRGDVASVTVSAAAGLADMPAEDVLPRLWRETAAALGVPADPMPAGRLIKEKRATFDQSPAGIAKRKGPKIGYANCVIAGDWTDTGLPATIESAVRSGERAADALHSQAQAA